MSRRARYRKMLTDSRWSQRRMEIMRRDGFRCRRCGGKGKLNVHHRWYIYGRQPWQYPDRCLVTLCERCHRHVHLMQHIRYALWLILLVTIAFVIRMMMKQ